MEMTLLKITAFLTLIPPALLYYRREPKRDPTFWLLLFVALTGVFLWVYVKHSTGWNSGLSSALWLTILASLLIYFITCTITEEGWRLNTVLFPHLLLIGILALIWESVPERPFLGNINLAWIGTHILVSVGTYGLLTIAALAAFAAMLQERALKKKKRNKLSRQLPSVAASEKILVNLLIVCSIVLTLGIISGMASLFISTGNYLVFDHKTVLTFVVFVIVNFIIFIHFKTGIRGKTAMRFVMLAYLLLSLSYPGVKFVKDVLLSA